MTKHHKHSRDHGHNHNRKHKYCLCECEPVPPWSETRWEPDAQWCPSSPVPPPLKVVREPFYTSSEDPPPQWAPNVPLAPIGDKHGSHHHHHHHHKFLHDWKDDIERHVYGRNPYSNTVNSGGSHFQ